MYSPKSSWNYVTEVCGQQFYVLSINFKISLSLQKQDWQRIRKEERIKIAEEFFDSIYIGDNLLAVINFTAGLSIYDLVRGTKIAQLQENVYKCAFVSHNKLLTTKLSSLVLWDLKTFEFDEVIIEFNDPVKYNHDIEDIAVLDNGLIAVATNISSSRNLDIEDDREYDNDFDGDTCRLSIWKVKNDKLEKVRVLDDFGFEGIDKLVGLPNKKLAIIGDWSVKFYDYQRDIFYLDYDSFLCGLSYLRDNFVVMVGNNEAEIFSFETGETIHKIDLKDIGSVLTFQDFFMIASQGALNVFDIQTFESKGTIPILAESSKIRMQNVKKLENNKFMIQFNNSDMIQLYSLNSLTMNSNTIF